MPITTQQDVNQEIQQTAVEDNQNVLYNNTESEGGINENSKGIEQDDKRRV